MIYFLLIIPVVAWAITRDAQITQAGMEYRKAADACHRWEEDHPRISTSWPTFQELVRERIRTRRAYVKVCPAQDDGGITERYLQDFLIER